MADLDYRCSECGGEVMVISLTVIPPITRFQCQKCGRTKDIGGGRRAYVHQPGAPITIDMSQDNG